MGESPGGFAPAAQPEPLVDGGQAEAHPFPVFHGPPQLLQPLLRHARAVVGDSEEHVRPLHLAGDQNAALAPLELDAVVEGVFHQGLKGQLGEPGRPEGGVDLDGVIQDILVAGLLNLEIAADLPLLLLQGDDVLPPAEGVAEELRQVGDHLHRRLGPVRLDEPDDGVHGVVQEVRVDLSLEEGQLRFPEAGLLLGDLLDLGVDPGDHLLHALAEGANLVGLGPDRLPDGQVAADDILRPAAQVHHRLGHGPAQPDAVAGQQQNQEAGQHRHQEDFHRDLPGNLLL